MTKWLLSFLALLIIAGPALAQTFPKLTGRVVDQANLLAPEQELDLTSKLEALEAQTGRQLVVVTLASLEGRTIEDYGYRLGRHWQIGDEKRDDGVLLIVAPKERKVRIETGYGARVFVTDAISSLIIRESILPRFRENDYPGGIQAGTQALIEAMSLSPAEAQKRSAEAEQRQDRRVSSGAGFVPIIFVMIVVFIVLSSMGRAVGGRRYRYGHGRRRGFDAGDAAIILWGLDALSRSGRGGGWGGGSGWGGGGGFGGFSGGGGSFGGGGASGSW